MIDFFYSLLCAKDNKFISQPEAFKQLMEHNKKECQHPCPATYHSTGKQKCHDCGKDWDIIDNNYAKHQR
jgi:hypothetical protein